MLLAGRAGNYSAPPPEKSMLGILRGAWGDFLLISILKKFLSRLSAIWGSCPPPLSPLTLPPAPSCPPICRRVRRCRGPRVVLSASYYVTYFILLAQVSLPASVSLCAQLSAAAPPRRSTCWHALRKRFAMFFATFCAFAVLMTPLTLVM